MEETPHRLLVLYASQTGNAMDAAERVGREAERRGCPAPSVLSIDDFDPLLAERAFGYLCCFNYWSGDNPDAMKVFWRFLLQKNLSRWWLEGLHFAVFGLGDSGYQKYNKLDKRLLDLGAKPIIEKGLGDDQHPAGYEAALDPWLSSLWSKLNQMFTSILPRISDIEEAHMRTLEKPKFQVKYHSTNKMDLHSSTDLSGIGGLIGRARSMSPARQRYGENNPQYFFKMVKNQRLNKMEYDRDVRHFELESLLPEFRYQLGDVLEILPVQDDNVVEAFIKRCNLDPGTYISVLSMDSETQSLDSDGDSLDNLFKLKDFVAFKMDVTSASPRRYFFEVMSFFATAEHEKERLLYFASPEGRDDLYKYNQKERRNVLEVLEDFPSVQMPFEWLVQLVPPLKTRAFSISSSPLAHPHQVHLTVSIVQWTTPYKRKRSGLCSTWLAGIDPENCEGIYIPAWVHRGGLPPPPPSLPLILIGPGTGCAPFRAFVEERSAQSTSAAVAPVLFFFGCRNKASDFLYRDFWSSHAQDHGVLSFVKGGGFFVAFSRDQPHKIYVQHKMKEESARIWNILSEGAAIYIAGSSTKMPADVTASFEEIVAAESGVSKESAAKWLRLLERAGRFHIETWS